MTASETNEERRARLKALAKQRAAALAGGLNVLSHKASACDTKAAADGIDTTRQLIETGAASFEIEKHAFKLSEAIGAGKPPERVFIICIDGIYVDAYVTYSPIGSRTYLTFFPVKQFSVELAEAADHNAKSHSGSNIYTLLYSELFGSLRENWLSNYLKAIHNRNAYILSEATRFRDVLTRKYRQLVVPDDYGTRDDSNFIEELKRFASSRLPTLDSEVVVNTVHGAVQAWIEDDRPGDIAAIFDPNMQPLEYERYCAQLFAHGGWQANLTPASGDQGADIICQAAGFRLVVQCKLYSSPVGNGAVQEVIAAREFEFADAAAVVSNATFTRSARELANVANVLLMHHEQIVSLSPDALRSELAKARSQ